MRFEDKLNISKEALGERIFNLIGEIVRTILIYSQPERIILFGSRAVGVGVNKERSDIGIAIIDPEITHRQMRRLRDAIDEIRTLHLIDIVWLNNMPEEFRNEVLSTQESNIRRRKEGLDIPLRN